MDARAVLRSWELDVRGELDEVPIGSVNRVFRASTSRGTVYLRAYKAKEREVVVREHAVIGHVVAAGLPAVAPLASPHGETVVVIDGTPFALYPEAAGLQLNKGELGIEHATAAGEMLGRLHACLSSLPSEGYRRLTLRWPRDGWIERLGGIARVVEGRAGDSDRERVLARLRDQREWLADARCAHEHLPAFPPQLIHGDYQHANLFFAAGRVSAVIDWEQAACMPRAFEVARAVTYMFDLAPELTRAFLRGYRAVTRIDDEELDDGARGWGCMSDHYVWALEEVYLQGNERARRYIPLPFRPFGRAWEAATR